MIPESLYEQKMQCASLRDREATQARARFWNKRGGKERGGEGRGREGTGREKGTKIRDDTSRTRSCNETINISDTIIPINHSITVQLDFVMLNMT